jgi:hypothetical protein
MLTSRDHHSSNPTSVSSAAAILPVIDSTCTVDPSASEPATLAATLQLAITELQQQEEHDSAGTHIVGQPARLAAAASARNHRAAAKEEHDSAGARIIGQPARFTAVPSARNHRAAAKEDTELSQGRPPHWLACCSEDCQTNGPFQCLQ